jgi:hypothetical protein
MRQLLLSFTTPAATGFKVASRLRVPRPLADYASGVDWMIPGGKAP